MKPVYFYYKFCFYEMQGISRKKQGKKLCEIFKLFTLFKKNMHAILKINKGYNPITGGFL